MTTLNLDNPHRGGLWANLAAFLVPVFALNGLIFALGWDGASSAGRDAPMIPPGAVVGGIWVTLFALMAASRWCYIRESGDRSWRAQIPVMLALACLAYPFYTDGLGNAQTGFYGVIATLAAALLAVGLLAPRSWRAAALIVPTALWGAYVTAAGVIYGL